MMRNLLVMRHAKSSWSDPALKDIDRPLNKRGREAAEVMGAYLAELALPLDRVILSPARRVQETWERMKSAVDLGDAVETVDALYMADADEMTELARGVQAQARSVLIIAHQPGLSDWVQHLTGGRASEACARCFSKFPTGAIAQLSFTGQWCDIKNNSCRFEAFTCPKDLV